MTDPGKFPAMELAGIAASTNICFRLKRSFVQFTISDSPRAITKPAAKSES